MLSIETLRSDRSTELRYVLFIPHSWARASWLRPRAARSRRIFFARTSRSAAFVRPLHGRTSCSIDGFKATAFKLHSIIVTAIGGGRLDVKSLAIVTPWGAVFASNNDPL